MIIPKIHSVVACCENGGIGYRNNLPWRLKKEMSHFRKLTRGVPLDKKKNAILMGRKTWESLPKALPGRYNFVLSRTLKEKPAGIDGIYSSLEYFVSAMESEEWSDRIIDIFCIGGAEIYKTLFHSPYCGHVYCTKVMAEFKCDVFMPDMTKFKVIKSPVHVPEGEQVEDDGTKWKVEVLEKSVE